MPQTAPKANILDVSIISTPEQKFCGWPTIARRANGELLAVCSGGRDLHVCPYGQVHLQRSSDNGKTWSKHEVIVDGPIDDRDAGVLETTKGTLVVFWFTSLAWLKRMEAIEKGEIPPFEDDRHIKWQNVLNATTPEQRDAELGTWCIRSEDGGKTWSAKIDTLVNSPHGAIQLSDGRIFYPGCAAGEDKRAGKGSPFGGTQIAAVSNDDGKTWQKLSDLPVMEGHESRQYHELHSVEAADGRIIVQIRNHAETFARETLQTESHDGGKTWTPVHSIGVVGFPSHLLRLRDGRLLMTYGYRNDPNRGNHVRISSDHGETWSEAMFISSDGTSDLGYPSTVQVDDDTLVTLWYEKLADRDVAVLRQATWQLEG